MREYSLPVVEALRRGVRPRGEATLNVPFLEDCVGFVPTPFGLSWEGVLVPRASTEVWPYPQLESFNGVTFRADTTGAGEVDGDNHAFTLRSLVRPAEGRRWHVAAGYSDWLAVNGESVLWKDVGGGDLNRRDHVVVQSAAFAHERYWLGGMDAESYIRAFGEDDKASLDDSIWYNLGPNTVLWGRIGAAVGDLFLDEEGKWLSGDTGFIHLSPMWLVHKILPFRDGVMVYGNNSVSYVGVQEDGAIGKRLVMDEGIRGPDAAGGLYSPFNHLYVGESGRLHYISRNFAVKTLDYRDRLDGGNYFVEWNPTNGLWYVGDERRTLVLDEGLEAMGTVSEPITALVWAGGATFDSYASVSQLAEYKGFKTCAIDMRRRDIKTLTSVQVHASGEGELEVAVESRYSASEPWGVTPFYPVNGEGSAMVRQAGVEFRVVVRTAASRLSISRVDVRYQSDGKRFVRGTSAPPAQQ